jgi:SWI/SNF-related matrix-associated actin-dependent regulator of chromatin subfamily B protein 1
MSIQQSALDESQEKWWESWRRRVRDIRGVVGTGGGRSKKKRKVVVNKPNSNTVDVNAGGGEARKMVKVEEVEKGAVTFDVSVDDEEFGRPMAIDEIKLDEELMHEDMRILIKVRSFPSYEYSQ